MPGMHQNRIWLAFLAIISLVLLWHTAIFAFKFTRYSTLTSTALSTHTEWSIAKLGTDRYALHVKYSYDFNGKSFQNEETLGRPLFRNTFAAGKSMPGASPRLIWFSPDNPDYSTSDKSFPLKEAVYAGVMWLLLLYFIWLGIHVNKRQIQWN